VGASRGNRTAYTKRGIKLKSVFDRVQPYVAAPGEPPRYALHFSNSRDAANLEKIGLNPHHEYNTPTAVCAYPLTAGIFQEFANSTLPFAQNTTRYLYVVKIKPTARVVYSTPEFKNAGVGAQYVAPTGDYTENLRAYFYASRRSPHAWAKWLVDQGIDVWVDANNEKILHSAEPTQVMFFNPRSYRVVDMMLNPTTKGQIHDPEHVPFREILSSKTAPPHVRTRALTLLRDADLRGIRLSGANLAGANLENANLELAQLMYAKLTGANLTGANLYGAHLWDAKLMEANLTGANLENANLRWAELMRAYLSGAKLADANLSGANLTGANLTGADLSGADLRYAKLSGANLMDAVLTGANLTDANLESAKWNDKTRWPAGFTPPARANRSRRK
jgi:hypothetical protein